MVIYNLGSVPEWVTAVASVVGLTGVFLAFRDFLQRSRPYIDVELQTNIVNKDWHFSVLILNKGKYPVFSKITKAMLTIGDEKYPTHIDQEIVIFPSEDKKIFTPVGHINETGRKKIRQAKYTKNAVILEIEVSSRKIKEKEYKYKTKLKVQVLVEEDKPGFVLLKKVFI